MRSSHDTIPESPEAPGGQGSAQTPVTQLHSFVSRWGKPAGIAAFASTLSGLLVAVLSWHGFSMDVVLNLISHRSPSEVMAVVGVAVFLVVMRQQSLLSQGHREALRLFEAAIHRQQDLIEAQGEILRHQGEAQAKIEGMLSALVERVEQMLPSRPGSRPPALPAVGSKG